MHLFIATGFFITLVSAIFLIFLERKGNFGRDYLEGDQKFHCNPTPRTGGLAIALSIIISMYISYHENVYTLIFPAIVLLVPAAYEDIVSSIKPFYRLLLIFLAVFFLVYMNSLEIKNLGLSYLDYFLDIPSVNFLFTLITLSLLINSFNVIDGFNGLLSGFCLMVLASIAFISDNVGEVFVYEMSLLSIMSILGFFILNFPYGRIFLGDAGAYFLGILIGYLVINLTSSSKISVWFALSILIYPVYELVFSMIRKKFFFNSPAMQPDSFHLHMLIHKNLINCNYFKNKIFCNSSTSIIVWALSLFSIIPSILWYDESLVLFLVCILFIFVYTLLYLKLIALERK